MKDRHAVAEGGNFSTGGQPLAPRWCRRWPNRLSVVICRYSVFFRIRIIDVYIGIGISKYRAVGLVFRYTHH